METSDLLARAVSKLHSKNADMIVANSLKDPGCGFGHDTNGVTLITKNGSYPLPVMSKEEVACKIFEKILEMNK